MKKIYSIIPFFNIPQIILSILYMIILENVEVIPFIAMMVNLLCIMDTIFTLIIQKRVYQTQDDYILLTVDVVGNNVMENSVICRNRVSNIKKYLCDFVWGINTKSVQIIRPYLGNIRNGLQLQIHITPNQNNINFEELLNVNFDNNELQKIIQNEWQLSSLPTIGNISCHFRKSHRPQNVRVYTEDEEEEDDEEQQQEQEQIEEELENEELVRVNSEILDQWNHITEYQGVSRENTNENISEIELGSKPQIESRSFSL